jgi:hypothetical protein
MEALAQDEGFPALAVVLHVDATALKSFGKVAVNKQDGRVLMHESDIVLRLLAQGERDPPVVRLGEPKAVIRLGFGACAFQGVREE